VKERKQNTRKCQTLAKDFANIKPNSQIGSTSLGISTGSDGTFAELNHFQKPGYTSWFEVANYIWVTD